MKLLIDEQLSPTLVDRLAKKGIFAQHVAHMGLSGESDPTVWRYAYENDQITVTMNVGDSSPSPRESSYTPALLFFGRADSRARSNGHASNRCSIISKGPTCRSSIGSSRFADRANSNFARYRRGEETK